MISWNDLYTVLTAVIPLYVAMILAYGSVRWWKIFSPDQCSGINRFVAVFAVPLLSFHFISTNDIYKMNFRFIAADTLQKIIMLVALGLWTTFSRNGSLEWMITIFSLSTLPNTLVMGIPLLLAMYSGDAGSLMVQVVVMQCIIWYTLLLFLFEYRGAKILIMEQFPETAASIVSFKVESDVMSLDGRDFLETDAEIGDDGKLHVTVRKSNASRHSLGLGPGSFSGLTPRPSNLTGAEIYSLSSSRNPTPRGSNFNNSDFYSMMGMPGFPSRLSNCGPADMYSVQSSRGPTPRPSNFEENMAQTIPSPRFGFYPAQTVPTSYPAPNPEIANAFAKAANKTTAASQPQQQPPPPPPKQEAKATHGHDAKELHMFVWSSSASPVSEGGGLHVFGGNDFGASEQSGRSDQGAKEIRMIVADHPPNGETKGAAAEAETFEGEDFSFVGKGEGEEEKENGPNYGGMGKLCSSSTAELHPKGPGGPDSSGRKQMPPTSVMTRLILIMVWRKLIRNPNTYSSIIGLTWSLITFRPGWNVTMPKIVDGSIKILSDAGLGMAMFSLGLFMALQPKLIACGNTVAAFSFAVRFLTGPAVMAAASTAIGLRGRLLHVAIVQAALPQGIVPFVFAKEYNVHPAILSTGVIFGMLIALPITLVYYILLGI